MTHPGQRRVTSNSTSPTRIARPRHVPETRVKLGDRCVRGVAVSRLTGGNLPGADAFERRERPAGVRDDPHVQHRGVAGLGRSRRTRAVQRGESGQDLLLRVVGEAQIAVHMPLRERSTDVGYVGESAPERQLVHRGDCGLLPVAVFVDDGLGAHRVEDATVVDV